MLSEGGGELYVSDGRDAPATAVEWQEGGWHTVSAELARGDVSGAAGRIVIEAADRPVGVAWMALLS
ncbi:hypothetical protein [Cohnella rhizosphaerae]|uniref:Uncharacterized protein n=1 Tax=Cohnella rhizosphaerae TaxID=1457232 RepID=A0A9X4L0C2_9BACL|nr:hypothetical protein [Cohnella rhizosphaerae]MDG0814203.1 hypothetical protein [Cohnella rhizosphaerae]